MTSRRRLRTGVRLKSWLAGGVLGVAALFAGCASLPEDATVLEQLDEDTGITIARLGKPMELYRETFRADPVGKFAFLAPFETNSMGTRELYLWLALPVTVADGALPDLEVDGRALKLGPPGREADFAGLRRSPYQIPTPWSAMFYYKIDADVVNTLSGATTLVARIAEADKDGTRITVYASTVADPRLRDFAAR